MSVDKNFSTAQETLALITLENSKLRAATTATTPNDDDVLQESTFDVELDEPLCEMRPDTRLVLVEVPGLNQAGSKDIYRDYVFSHWNSLDCVIVVMDVFQGVNTEEQVKLLKLVQQQNSSTMDDNNQDITEEDNERLDNEKTDGSSNVEAYDATTKKNKSLPIIVLCNKVDDFDNEEVALLVEEVRATVENFFADDVAQGLPAPGT